MSESHALPPQPSKAKVFFRRLINYAELITPTLWPDFRKPQFHAALEEYARRHRRFGAV